VNGREVVVFVSCSSTRMISGESFSYLFSLFYPRRGILFRSTRRLLPKCDNVGARVRSCSHRCIAIIINSDNRVVLKIGANRANSSIMGGTKSESFACRCDKEKLRKAVFPNSKEINYRCRMRRDRPWRCDDEPTTLRPDRPGVPGCVPGCVRIAISRQSH
jgi:hypothetical protein